MSKTDCEFPPCQIKDGRSTPFGFVIDHPSYWGIPIPGFDEDPQPTGPTDPVGAPSKLTVVSAGASTKRWTAGGFDIFATRTPPLFHSFHHKTDERLVPPPGMHGGGGHSGGGHSDAFEHRAERNLAERSFSPRNPLPGQGRYACVELVRVRIAKDYKSATAHKAFSETPFSSFDSRGLVRQARAAGYFETQLMTWNSYLVGPLGALWIVILQEGSNNTPIARLGGGYRLWHFKERDHRGKQEFNGYKWAIEAKNDFHDLKFSLSLSGCHNLGRKECPLEEVCVDFELQWS